MVKVCRAETTNSRVCIRKQMRARRCVIYMNETSGVNAMTTAEIAMFFCFVAFCVLCEIGEYIIQAEGSNNE